MIHSLSCTLLFLGTIALPAAEWPPTIVPSDDKVINGRLMETLKHGARPEWGYAEPQEDTFVVVHPKTKRDNAPLYVVLHSAGHDVFSAVKCTEEVGNHDIYRSPDHHYALYLDCRKNQGKDWWWGGMHQDDKVLVDRNSGSDTSPVEKRVMDTVAWALEHYEVDPNRVYLAGNSMGGSGALGIGMRRGDVFAAIKANVPAGVEHVAERMSFPPKANPESVILPDPPICIDYSAQNDGWSVGHDRFAHAMNERKYPFLFYWGPFGHANNSAEIVKVNDLIDSFDWLSVKKNEAYPIFTNASTNSQLPWPDDLKNSDSGQINAFFRWKLREDSSEVLDLSLLLASAKDLKTAFKIPEKARTDVTLRRLQHFKLTPGATFSWRFGEDHGEGKVDSNGLITINELTITGESTRLRILSEPKKQASTTPQTESKLKAEAGSVSIDFTSEIKPILKTHCIKCHANGKRKGGFSMDHIHALIAGGEGGPAVVPGKSAESHLMALVSSADADERMPPKGDPLTADEVTTLSAWIDQGLPWEKGFTFATVRNAPIAPRLVALPIGDAAHPVDRLLASYFKEHQVEASSVVGDAVFARRVFLDTIGLLPTPDELAAFCLDRHPDKRGKLVTELLADEVNYSAHWFTFWSDCLRNSLSRSYHGGGGKQITDWLKDSLSKNKPYDQFVRELIDPVEKSSGFVQGIAWRGTVNASQVTEMQAAQNVAQVFLGLNIKCASCHDSFINDWTLKQTYGFASIFADQPMDIHRCDKPLGEKAMPSFLYPDLGTIDPAASKSQRVKQLSEIITSPDNGRLARTMVNRLWAIFFGHGIIEPVDEMDNPAWNQDLLDWLAVDLVHNGYDLKHTMTLLLTSQAYQRTAVPLDPDGDDFVFSGPVVRRLSAEQFLDSLDQVIAAANDSSNDPRGAGQKRWGLRKIDPLIRTLGRTKRDVVVTQRESVATTAQLIELSNGKALADTIGKGSKAWLDAGHESDIMIETLFLQALARNPADREKDFVREIVGIPPAVQGIEDFLWMLAMHPEFQLIH